MVSLSNRVKAVYLDTVLEHQLGWYPFPLGLKLFTYRRHCPGESAGMVSLLNRVKTVYLDTVLVHQLGWFPFVTGPTFFSF